jgi:hypothetical protein
MAEPMAERRADPSYFSQQPKINGFIDSRLR